MKYNKYSVVVTDDYYVPAEDGTLAMEWRSEVDKTFKPTSTIKKGFTSFEKAMEYVYSLNTSDSILIDDECCGMVYESINECHKCKCCGNEKWDKITMDHHHTEAKESYQLAEK